MWQQGTRRPPQADEHIDLTETGTSSSANEVYSRRRILKMNPSWIGSQWNSAFMYAEI